MSIWAYSMLVYWLPRSEWWMSSTSAPGALSQCHPQRVQDEIRAHVGGELPADDPAAEGVDNEREEDDPLPAAQIGQIGQPELNRAPPR